MVFVLMLRVILGERSHTQKDCLETLNVFRKELLIRFFFIQGKPPQAPNADETGKLVKFFSVLYCIDRKIIKIKT